MKELTDMHKHFDDNCDWDGQDLFNKFLRAMFKAKFGVKFSSKDSICDNCGEAKSNHSQSIIIM